MIPCVAEHSRHPWLLPDPPHVAAKLAHQHLLLQRRQLGVAASKSDAHRLERVHAAVDRAAVRVAKQSRDDPGLLVRRQLGEYVAVVIPLQTSGLLVVVQRAIAQLLVDERVTARVLIYGEVVDRLGHTRPVAVHS